MIEEVVGKALEWMLAQGGGYVLAVLVGIYAWKERSDAVKRDATAQDLIRQQYEKRLDEFRELLDVMTNSTNTVTAMHSSLTASSEAINQLATGFTRLLAEFQAQQGRWDDRRGAMAKQLDDIQTRIEHLQRNAGRVA